MRTKLISILLIVLFVGVAGCTGTQSPDDSNQNTGIPDNLNSQVKNSIKNQDTYQYEMKITNNYSYTEVTNQSNKVSNKVILSSIVKHDKEDKKLSLNNTIEAGNQPPSARMIYAKDDFFYQQQYGTWLKINITKVGGGQQFWENQNRLSIFTDIMNTTEITNEQTKTLNGTDYIVLEYNNANKTELWENAYAETGIGSQVVSGLNMTPSENIDELKVEQWICKDSLKPAKIISEGKLSRIKRTYTRNQTDITYTYSMEYDLDISYKYEGTDFQIPDEVLNATEMGG